jgi:hypothetical protein
MRGTTITEIQTSEWDTFDESVLSSDRPVVLRGLVSDWPAVAAARTSTEQLSVYLEEFATDKPVTAMQGDAAAKGRLFYNAAMDGFNFEYIRLSLREATQKILSFQESQDPPSLYVGSTNVDHWLPGFRAENDIPIGRLSPLVSIWLGNRSTVAAHYDFPSNIACVVAGRRRVTLFPPDQLENLYVGPLDLTPAGQPISLVDLKQPDYTRYPRFREAEKFAQTAELSTGDAIVIPSMWWHHMEATDPFNLLVNYWWRDTPAYMGPPLSVLQHAILGLRDLPPRQREHWKRLFDFYVFDPTAENFEHIPEEARGVLNKLDEDIASGLRGNLRNKLL